MKSGFWRYAPVPPYRLLLSNKDRTRNLFKTWSTSAFVALIFQSLWYTLSQDVPENGQAKFPRTS